MAETVVDQLEAIQVEKHDDQGLAGSSRLLYRQVQPVQQHGPIRQFGEQVVVGLVGNQFLRLLATGNIACDTVGTLVGTDLFRTLRVDRVNSHRFELYRADRGLEWFRRIGGITFQTELDGAIAAAFPPTLVEQVLGFHAVFVGDNFAVVFAD